MAKLTINKKKRTQGKKAVFLEKLSYELRTPLNSIIGFSELIKKEKAGSINKEQKEYLHDILLSAKHLLKIIEEVKVKHPFAKTKHFSVQLAAKKKALPKKASHKRLAKGI